MQRVPPLLKRLAPEVVALTHHEKAAGDMRIELVDVLFNERNQHIAQERPPGHPLVVVPTVMRVRSVEAAPWKCSFEPAESLLMACVHAQRDLGLSPITAEVPLAHEQTEQETN